MSELVLGVCALAALAVPIALLVVLTNALTRTKELARRVGDLEGHVAGMRWELHQLRSALQVPFRGPEPGDRPVVPLAPVPGVTPPPEGVALQPLPPFASPLPLSDASPPDASPEAPVAPPPEPPAPRPPAAPVAPPVSLEEQIGVTWFTRVGAAVLIAGAAYFFKYAVDNNWIGPWGRVALGAAAGVGALAFAEYVRRTTQAAYVQLVLGVGLALLYVTGYATYGFYHLVPLPAAFAALAVVALLGGALSVHHRSQAILVTSLAAALANPVLLSTGQDRPLALFAYLLLATTGVLLVALRLRFVVAAWLAMAGVGALGVGWYATFFDAAPPTFDHLTGRAVPGTAGAYHPLATRAVPLAFAALFAAQWIALGVRARRAAWTALVPAGALLAGLLLVHGASAALLGDHPALLAAAMVLGAGAATALLRAPAEAPLLAVPFVASFFVLAAQATSAGRDPLVVLGLAGLWSATYMGALVYRGRPQEPSTATTATLALLALGSVFAVALAALLLVPDRRALLAGALALLAVASVGLAAWSARAWLGAVGAAAALVALLAAAPRADAGDRTDAAFLALAGAWGAVWVLAGAYALLRRRAPASPTLVATTVGGALGFVAAALLATAAGEDVVRALCAAGAGAALFPLGAATLRARPDARGAATALLGAAVGLFALAVALAFSGVTVTLVWALFAAVAAHLAARARDRAWLAGALALVALVLGRVLAVDMDAPRAARALFEATLGREGALHPTALWNARALALAGTAAALFAAALSWRAPAAQPAAPPGEAPPEAHVSAVLATLGHAALLGLVVTEVRELVTTYPAFPGAGLDPAEFEVFMARVREAFAAQVSRRAVSVTLATGTFGAAALAGGFALRSVLHRWIGLAVLGGTVGKLLLWDVWTLPRLGRVVVLIAVGVLLLGAGFLYARFGRRLVGLFRAGAAALALAALTAPGRAAALDPAAYGWTAAAETARAGVVVVEVTPALYRASRAGPTLDDLRIEGPDGREAPWFLRARPAAREPAERPAEVLDPVTLPDGATQATFDLGPGGARHTEVALDVVGSEFIRRCRVEVSDDRAAWALLATARVFRASGGGTRAEGLAVRHPVSAARYVRATIEGERGRPPVAIVGGRVVFRPAESLEPVRALPLRVLGREAGAGGRTATVLDAGGAGVPVRAFVLTAGGDAFERRVVVEAANHPGYWTPAGWGVVFRAGGDASLRVVGGGTQRYFRLVEEHGDDPPLAVEAVDGEYRVEEVVFRARDAGRYVFFVGRAGERAPVYDLRGVVERERTPVAAEATLSGVRPNPRYRRPAAPPGPWTERWRVPIGLALGALLAALVAWAARLLRSHPAD